jgi:3',5'-cyclic AMP phosphodiesterase CpdA
MKKFMDKQPLLFKLAHLSDLHFSKIGFSLKSLFTKESIGNLNLLLHRKNTYRPLDAAGLIQTLKQELISHVVITGDLSTTSSEKEFIQAKQLISLLEQEKFPVFVIPGNHDNYTKHTHKNKIFYRHFHPSAQPLLGYDLKTHKTGAYYLGDHVWLVLIDTTEPAPVYFSTGRYDTQCDLHLKTLLQSIPSSDLVVVLNHFPLLDIESKRRRLIGSELLQNTLKQFPNVKLYLHGHTHQPNTLDLRGAQLPIVSDSGSLSHYKKGSWNSLEIYPSSCQITNFRQHKRSWVPYKHFSYTW